MSLTLALRREAGVSMHGHGWVKVAGFIAVDLLPIAEIEGVQIIQGDFTDLQVRQQIQEYA